MPVDVNATLEVAAGAGQRPLNVSDFQTGATGAAKDATVGYRFAPGKTTRGVQVATLGDNTIITPALGKKVRLHWLGLSTSQNNAGEVEALVKFGTTVIYRWQLGNPGAFSHWETVDGATDQALVINLSQAYAVNVNYTYQEIV